MASAVQDSPIKPEQPTDEAIMAQVQKIQDDIALSSKLVGDAEVLDVLEEEYQKSDAVYQAKIQSLKTHYKRIRRTRPDGNCFFRAFAFAYLENLQTDAAELARFKARVVECKDGLIALGFPEFTTLDFYDTFMDVLSQVENGMTTDGLVKVLANDGVSDYIVVFLRLLTSGELQRNSDFYAAFIETCASVQDFCSLEVEPMYRESDNIHISALSAAVQVPLRVVHMDRVKTDEVNHHDFQEDLGQPRLHLLYRPGHYDILYQ